MSAERQTSQQQAAVSRQAGSSAASSTDGLGTQITGIVSDLQDIVRGEVALAKAELREDASTIGRAATMLVAGGLIALVGFIFVMLGATYLLNRSLSMWLSAGIVGVALLIVAVILLMVGRSKLSAASMTPTETIDSLKEDQQWVSQQIKSVGK